MTDGGPIRPRRRELPLRPRCPRVSSSDAFGAHTEPFERASAGASASRREVTAEGIEHAEEAARLQSSDCPLIQGFFISKPLGENACRSFLEEWAAAGSLDIAARLHPRTDGRSTPPARAAATS